MKMQFIMLHTHNARKATMHIAELYASFKTPICLPQLRIKRNAILQWIKALLSQLHLSWTTIHETIYNLFPLFLEHIRINRPPCNKHLSLEDGSLKRHRYSAWIPSAVHTWEGFFSREKRYLILLIIIILNTTENLSQLSTFLSFFSAYFLNTKSVDWIRFYADWNLCMPKRKTSRTFGSGMGRDFG